jgi:hypothetical protein
VSLARLVSVVIAGAAVVAVAVVVIAVVKARVFGRVGGDQIALVDRVALLEAGEDEIDLILAVTVGYPLTTQVGVGPRAGGVVVGVDLVAMWACGAVATEMAA